MWSIWNEPNQPQFLKPQYVHGKPKSPTHLPQALPRRPARPPRVAGQRRRHDPDRRDRRRAATPHVVAPARVPARDAVPRTPLPPQAATARGSRPAATPTTPTRRAPARASARRTRTTSRSACCSRLSNALDQGRPGGRDPARLAIYLTEFGIQSTPDKISGVSLTKQAEYLAIAEHIAYVNPRVASFSQYLLARRQAAQGPPAVRYGGFECGLRFAGGKAKPAYDAFRLPLAVEAYGPSDVLWGRVRPSATQTKVQILASRRKGKPFKLLRTRHHQPPRRLRAARQAPRQAALPRALDRAGRQGLDGPADPRHEVTLEPSRRALRRAEREEGASVRDPRRMPGGRRAAGAGRRPVGRDPRLPLRAGERRRQAGRDRDLERRRRLHAQRALRRRGDRARDRRARSTRASRTFTDEGTFGLPLRRARLRCTGVVYVNQSGTRAAASAHADADADRDRREPDAHPVLHARRGRRPAGAPPRWPPSARRRRSASARSSSRSRSAATRRCGCAGR